MSYQEKLIDPRWQKKRLMVFDRDEWRCQICGDKNEQLECHHACGYDGSEPWDYPSANLQTRCHTCHSLEQFKMSKIRSFVEWKNGTDGRAKAFIDSLV